MSLARSIVNRCFVGRNLNAYSSALGAHLFRRVGNNRFFCTPPYSSLSLTHKKLLETLKSELDQEKSDYKGIPQKLKNFLNSNVWSYNEKPGDVNIVLSRDVHGKRVTIDFQLVNPNLDGEEMEEDVTGGSKGGDDANGGDTTDFSVTIEDIVGKDSEAKSGGGVIFYCSTVAGEEYRYLIGNVRLFKNEAEKNLVSAYNGPEFESLDSELQKNLEAYLEMHGINSDVCDLIDELAIDKETREYTNWLQGFVKFVEK